MRINKASLETAEERELRSIWEALKNSGTVKIEEQQVDIEEQEVIRKDSGAEGFARLRKISNVSKRKKSELVSACFVSSSLLAPLGAVIGLAL